MSRPWRTVLSGEIRKMKALILSTVRRTKGPLLGSPRIGFEKCGSDRERL
jgi:hypothetical protein